jgi:hypothetical protein
MTCEISSTWTFVAGGITGAAIVIGSILIGLWVGRDR